MNIYTVRDNLKNTIAGKMILLEQNSNSNSIVQVATAEYLRINIKELENILRDVEICCQQTTDLSWQINPEQMGR